jgi:hypothetical protein
MRPLLSYFLGTVVVQSSAVSPNIDFPMLTIEQAALEAMEASLLLFPNNPNLIYEACLQSFARNGSGVFPLRKYQVTDWIYERRQWNDRTVQDTLERLFPIHGESVDKLFEESQLEYFRNGKVFPLSKRQVADWIHTRTTGNHGSSSDEVTSVKRSRMTKPLNKAAVETMKSFTL